ncbi:unnamed protein product [Moneuplotes crassus]|uniref:Uncharacterized protein n=1 Tax=Euplotes crassus TaxID=5936 RepID=A0AAD2DCB0_EUPCR|nr:unnamed protein product [Moneuplotes crassus]
MSSLRSVHQHYLWQIIFKNSIKKMRCSNNISCSHFNSLVIFNIDEIERFKDQQNLDEAWDGFLPDLETFKDVYIDLKKKYKKAEEEKQWWTFVYLLSDARALLNLIFDSELMKHYNRHLHSRSYQESKRGIIQTEGVDQSFMRNKLSKLEEDLTNKLITPLKEKLRRTTEENDHKDRQIEVMKEEQKRLEQIEQTLQEKDNESQETIQELNETIEFKSQEEAKRTAQIDELQHQITSLESTLEGSKHTLDHSQLKAIHNSITNSTTTFDSSSSLKFDLDEASSQTLLEALQLNTLPPLNKLSFKYTRGYYRPEPISKFLLNAVPQGHNSLRKFVFDAHNSPFVSVRRYLRAFERVFSHVSNLAKLICCKMTKAEFERLVVAAKHCKKIKFEYCAIETDGEVDFGDHLDDSSFEEIDFIGTGESECSDWESNDFVRFENIIKGFAKTKPRDITMTLENCNITEDKAQSILDKYGLTKITLQISGMFKSRDLCMHYYNSLS